MFSTADVSGHCLIEDVCWEDRVGKYLIPLGNSTLGLQVADEALVLILGGVWGGVCGAVCGGEERKQGFGLQFGC